jgi:hypothetical protein
MTDSWLSCFMPFDFLSPKDLLNYFAFQSSLLWTRRMKVFPEMCRVH